MCHPYVETRSSSLHMIRLTGRETIHKYYFTVQESSTFITLDLSQELVLKNKEYDCGDL